MGLEKREARPHRAHRPAAPRSSFRDRRTGTPPAPRDTGKGPLILRGPEARLHPPRLRLIPGQPLKNYFRLSKLELDILCTVHGSADSARLCVPGLVTPRGSRSGVWKSAGVTYLRMLAYEPACRRQTGQHGPTDVQGK